MPSHRPVPGFEPEFEAGREPATPRLDELRRTIERIERRATLAEPTASEATPWRLGPEALDARLGGGLETAAVHEIKPVGGARAIAAAAAARRFALALAIRRAAGLETARRDGPLVWCTTSAAIREGGRLYGPGLGGPEPGNSEPGGSGPGGSMSTPSRLLLVEAAKAADVLWAAEEALKSGAATLVVAEIEAVDLTPARRLALAAAATDTPCVLLTHASHGPAAATSTRWRIAPAPGAPHPFDPHAPGASRLEARIERSRLSPALESTTTVLEWSDAAFRFRVVPRLADRAARPHLVERQPRPAVARARGA